MAGPLTGIRVLEVANFISGPYAGMLLADLGAEVWKVEMVGSGDPFRKWGGHPGGVRPQFAAYNRGKKSVALDLTKPSAQEALRRLAAHSDVLLENFRPGTLDRLGLGYEAVRTANPGLIYCSISGMGRTGPYARRPSYDSIGLGLSGLWSRFVDLKRPRPIGPQVADQVTSLFTAYGILGALVHRATTGAGQRVDTSMLMANMAFIPEPVANYTMLGEVGGIETRARRSQAYAFVASDDLPLTIHLSSVPKFWEGLLRAVGRPDLAADPRFASNADRVGHYAELRAILEDEFRTRPRAVWLERLEAEDVPCAPINSLPEAITSPQAQYLGAIQQFGEGPRAVELVRSPVEYSDTPIDDRLPPPLVGEHTEELLKLAGYGRGEIDELAAEGAVGLLASQRQDGIEATVDGV